MRRLLLLLALLSVTAAPSARAGVDESPAALLVLTKDGPDRLRSASTLGPAAPNPFSEQTKFTLTLDRAQPIRAEVFDLLGRPVRTLQSGVLQAGAHILTLDANGLPNGVYVVRVSGDRWTATRRVVLAR